MTTSPTDAGAPETGRDKHLIGLEEAAELLGLAPSFLQWALESGLMKGEMDGNGRWTLPRSEIAAGLELLETQAEEPRAAAPSGDGGAPVQEREAFALKAFSQTDPASQTTSTAETAQAEAPSATAVPDSADPAEIEVLRDEIRFLRKLVQDRNAALAAKDQVIAKLSLEISRLAETALNRLPRG